MAETTDFDPIRRSRLGESTAFRKKKDGAHSRLVETRRTICRHFDIRNIGMAILKILTYPDPFLKKKADPVIDFDDPLKQLAADMIETMYASLGVGLAATQVGANKRMIVLDVKHNPKDPDSRPQPQVMINPTVVQCEGEAANEEGCLSVPDFRTEVKRCTSVTLTYRDMENSIHRVRSEGLESICIQHELDHLNGKLFIDHLPPLQRQMVKTKLKKRSN